MKNYGAKNQIGYGQSYELYLKDLTEVFKKILSITQDNGSLWIIIDTFRKSNELVPLPFDLARHLQAIGWKFRDVMIWKKERTVPWHKHGDTRGIFEYVLFFSKTDNFRYAIDRVREVENLKRWWVKWPERYNPNGKSLEGIWAFDIPVQGSWGNGEVRHFCPLPPGLIRRILQITTEPGHVVLDPFAGTGSVLTEAYKLGRRSMGVELDKNEVTQFGKRMRTFRLETAVDEEESARKINAFRKMVLSLRILKYARVLRKKLPRTMQRGISMILVERLEETPTEPFKIVCASYTVFAENYENSAYLLKRMRELASKPPLSKFGIEPRFKVVRGKPTGLINGRPLYRYTDVNTHCHVGRFKGEVADANFQIVSSIEVKLNEQDYA